MRERLKNILGPVGLFLVLVGAIIYGVLYESGWAAVLPLVLGVALSAVALFIDFRSFRSEGRARSTRYGLNTAVTVLITAALIIFAQTLSMRHNLRADLTSNRRFSLSPQTVKILEGLDSDVRLTCFFRDNAPEKVEVEDLLSEMRKINPRLSYRFVDPDQDPMTARRYDLKEYNSVFVELGGTVERLSGYSEERIVNAVARVVSPHGKKVYFCTGHGEKSPGDEKPAGMSALAEALRLENYEVGEFATATGDAVPGDCSALVLAGPYEDYMKSEQNMIFDYITRGGDLLLMVDPMDEVDRVISIASAFGIDIGNDIIVDPDGNRLTGNYLTPVVTQYGKHPVTMDFKLFSFFPQARSVFASDRIPDAVTVTILGKTGDKAYAEVKTDTLRAIGKTQYEPMQDTPGPVPVVAAAEMEIVLAPADTGSAGPGNRARIVVFGDSDFATNANFKLSGNRDLVLNSINWLAEEKDMISIRPAEVLNQPVLLSSEQGRLVFWLPVVGLPALFALIGILVNIRNRRSP